MNKIFSNVITKFLFSEFDSEKKSIEHAVNELRLSPEIFAFYNHVSELKSLLDSSKKLFILGAGTSVNSLSKGQWGEIQENVSLGHGSFLMHDFQPDIAFVEFPYHGNQYLEDLWTDIYLERIDHNHSGHLIMDYRNYTTRPFHRFKDHLSTRKKYFLNASRFRSNNSKFLSRYLEITKSLKSNHMILNLGGSLSTFMQLAYNMGFKEVVLVGYDGCKSYFTSSSPSQPPIYQNFNEMRSELDQQDPWKPKEELHSTLCARSWGLSQKDFLETFAELYSSSDFKVTLGTPSVLESMFKPYSWSK